MRLNVQFDKAQLTALRRKMEDGGQSLWAIPFQAVMRDGATLLREQALQRAPGSITAMIVIAPLNPNPIGIARVVIRQGGSTAPSRGPAFAMSSPKGKKGKRWLYARHGGAGSGASHDRGFVGRILNMGGRGGRQRFRTGPRTGVLTIGWLSRTIRLVAVKRGMDTLVRRAAAEIEGRWAA